MRRAAWTIVFTLALMWASRAPAAPQAPIVEAESAPAQEVGLSLASAATNIAFFPVRLALTIVTAEVGGLTGFLTGGDRLSAGSVWDSTDGPGYITPAIMQGREPLRFGPQQTY